MNNKQLELIEKLNLDFDVPDDLSLLPDEKITKLGDAVSDYLQHNGMGPNDGVNAVGLICESILDIISDL